MLRKSVILAIVIILQIASLVHALEVPQPRLKIANTENCYIPYVSNHPLHDRNEDVEHVILAIHSSNHDAFMVYNNCMGLVDSYGDLSKRTLVIAPQFLMEKHLESSPDKNLLFWKVYPFWGSSISTTKSAGRDLRISAYSILDQVISDIFSKATFPNAQRLTILGHSAGGQLVNRFAASNTVEFDAARPAGVHCRYIVMNPSSYVYFSPKRSVDGSTRGFSIPPRKVIESHPGYNNYGYGLDKLYSYHRNKGLTAEKIRQTYPQRNVIYLLGEEDCVADASMSTHPHAMLQGDNRLDRGKIYYGHLIDEFGPGIRNTQQIAIIPEVGHSGKQTILSRQGHRFILK